MSSSSSSGSSASTPTVVTTPENGILDQIAGYASQLAPQMYNWAQGVFAQTSQITNAAVGNFFQVSQNMLGLSGNLTSQYNNLFAPENAQLVADANSYASPARMEADMGMAGATAAQAGSSALANSEEQLRSFGIDPSSGRYAALDKAAAVQNAANVAGAENQQRVADINTGQQLRSQAVQVGATLPAAISNVNNTAVQANTGAADATLANANTGANLMSLPDKYLQTAMGLKLSPVGQNSASSQHSSSNGPQPQQNNGGQGSGGGNGGNSPSGPAWMPQHTGYQPDGGLGTNPGSHIMQPGAGSQSVPQGPEDPGTSTPMDSGGFTDYGSSTGSLSDPTGAGEFGSTFGQDFGGNTYGPMDAGTFGNLPGDNGSFGGSGDMTGLGDTTYDPNSNPAMLPPDWQNTPPQTQDPSGGWPDPGQTSLGGLDQQPPPDNSGSSSDTSGSSGMAGDSGSSMDYSDFAKGGDVMARSASPRPVMAEHGAFAGHVNPGMSPSGGARTDDVPAQGPAGQGIHLNAHEFVIPDDVARWKGEEFFQNLIAQSRKKRMTSPAHPTPGPPR